MGHAHTISIAQHLIAQAVSAAPSSLAERSESAVGTTTQLSLSAGSRLLEYGVLGIVVVGLVVAFTLYWRHSQQRISALEAQIKAGQEARINEQRTQSERQLADQRQAGELRLQDHQRLSEKLLEVHQQSLATLNTVAGALDAQRDVFAEMREAFREANSRRR